MEAFLEEKPTIDSAIKNLLSFILGTASIAQNSNEKSKTDRLKAQKVLGALLRNINSFTPSKPADVVAVFECLRKENKKITKNTGKAMLLSIWAEVEVLVFAECKSKGVDEELTKDVMSLLSNTLTDRDGSKDVQELVWAIDFNEVIRNRQTKRKEEVKQRLKEMKTKDEEEEKKRNDEDKPQIVEITDNLDG